MKQRRTPAMKSKGFVLNLAASCLQANGNNPKLIADVRQIADEWKRDGRGHYSEEDDKRIDRQRTKFNMLPTCREKDQLKKAMLQRAYDLLWDGDTEGCDALIEFLPSDDVRQMLDAWSADVEPGPEVIRSEWYRSEHAVV